MKSGIGKRAEEITNIAGSVGKGLKIKDARPEI